MTDISKKTGTFTSFDGTQIYFEVRGQGKPIVLCYGIGCLINHWVHQIKYFSKNYQTIVFDYRGHHSSAPPENRENLNIDAICRDIQGLLHHLDIPQASFWGHSFGVQILLRLFDMYPQSIANMVLINGFASNPVKGMFGMESLSTLFQIFKEGYKTFPETLKSIWRGSLMNPFAIQLSSIAGGFNLNLTSLKDIEVYARGISSMDLDVFLTLFDKMLTYDGSPVLDRINVPTLIIGGTKDGVTPVEFQEKIHQKIRGSELMIVPYGSHCTQLDLPEYVNLRIDKFLNSISYQAGALGKSKEQIKPWKV